MTTQTRLRIAIILLIGIVFIGTAGFHFIEHWPWLDGLYMTVVTMTTVGYSETHPLSPAGKVFNIFLILTAVMAGALLISTMTHGDATIRASQLSRAAANAARSGQAEGPLRHLRRRRGRP